MVIGVPDLYHIFGVTGILYQVLHDDLSVVHSDHHAKPDREYPLLQKYDKDQAPQLPFGYPLMIAICLIPVLWRKVMNPRVDKWREHFYPEFK